MYQIYFLSIIVNLIVGIALARNLIAGKFPVLGKFLEDIELTDAFRLAGGISAVAVGILKLLLVTTGDVLILGDLVPALAGIAAGKTLLSEHFRAGSSFGFPPWIVRCMDFLIATKQIWGVIAIAAAVLHFFFNQALFL
jgi:hypothetical protein